MQYVAVCCSVLQCVAVWCTLIVFVLQCVTACCGVSQCVAKVAVCFSGLQCVAICCSKYRGDVARVARTLDQGHPFVAVRNVLQCVAWYCSVV